MLEKVREYHIRIMFIIITFLMVFAAGISVLADTNCLTLTLDANGGIFPKMGLYEERTVRTEEIKLNDEGKNVYSINLGTNGKPEWEGKTLIGWSADKNATSAQWEWQTLEEITKEYIDPEDRKSMPMDGSITYLYAVWTDTYYIILDANGGDFGTNTDRYGNETPIEKLESKFWYINGGMWHSPYIAKVIKRNSEEVHKGWSVNKNAVKPEYSTGFEGLELNSSTPKTLYAIYGKEDDIDSDYGKIETEKSTETPDSSDKETISIKKGDVLKKGTASYKVLADLKTVAYITTVKKTVASITVPATVRLNNRTFKVTSIAANAFKNNTKLTKVIIGKNVTSIGANAFFGCKNLKAVTIGVGVKKIGKQAFAKCTKVTKIYIPSKVTVIGSSAFSGCTKLTSITIGKGVTTIGPKVFCNCKKLKAIKITSEKLEKIGANAFKNIYSKVTITVPKKKLKAYKHLLAKKGLTKKAKVK